VTEFAVEVEDCTVRFGSVAALSGVTIRVNRGQLFGLIGPNGSGKSTLLNCISRFHRSYGGTISVFGTCVDRLPAHRIAQLEVTRTFQSVELFPGRSVLDNVIVGVQSNPRVSLVGVALRSPRAQRAENGMRSAGERALELFGIDWRRDEDATSLPYGVQKLVDLARAAAPRPQLLLLDEPAAGMNYGERRELARAVLRLRADSPSLTIIWVEHDLKLMRDLCDRIVALSAGTVIAEGTPESVLADSSVIESYGAQT